ncbi:alpha/beta hydrolase [Pseudonocardia acaciae]|uniref:alpha/beta hydrolase n=1 Tax=Pseudonocardia acaciae TaxID=551276 RepID=UPI0012ECFBFF|nr:alpha/beta hydrolase [Pseudonocardia acaciae]
MSSALASELPELMIGVHAAAAAGALRSRGVSRAAGLALNGAALAGLAGLAGDARRSAHVLGDALRELGVTLPSELSGRRPVGVLPAPLARRRYRRVADVSYSEHGRFGTLDVWHRADLPVGGRAPVLVQVHGGGWTMGDKLGQAEPLLGYLAERGWVCVTVNYRLAPAQRWPAMIVDVKRAIAWVREHISGHGGDPDFVAITGGSAGAHLAALAALTPNDPAFQPGFTEVDTSLAAAVPMYGVHDFTRGRQGLWALLEGKVIGTTFATDGDTWRRASPALRVGPQAPPFLVVHGTTDTIVDIAQSRRLVAALRDASVPVGFAELPHAQHGFDALASARTAHTVAAVHRFLTAVHQREVPAGAGQTGRKRVAAGR